MRKPGFLFAVILTAFTADTAICAPASQSRPNVLLILCDDLGYGDLGCYGHPAMKTPTLDRLAAQGMRFTDWYAAAPVCSPSRAGLLTGRNPNRLGVYDWIPGGHPMHMKQGEFTIAELLRQAGYATGHFGKWHCNGMFNSPKQPQPGDQGFDYWFATQNNAGPSHLNPRNFVRNGQPVGPTQGYSCQVVTDETLDWIRSNRPQDKPFFAFVCFHETHEPVASPPELVAQYPEAENPQQAAYFANVANVDRAVGRLLAALDDVGAADNTLVVFTSDNGPETLKRYPNGVHCYGSPGPLRGMKLHIHEGGIRVPAILRWPGRIQPGQVAHEPAAHVDLLPTLCQVAGVEPPRDRPLDGASLLPLFKNQPIRRDTPLFWFYALAISRPQAALRDGDWKLVARWDIQEKFERVTPELCQAIRRAKLVDFELYNLRDDIAEQHDLARAHPERAAAMAARLKEIFSSIQKQAPVWPARQPAASSAPGR